MSNHWETYPCDVDGSPASVLYDHGISEVIDTTVPETLLVVTALVKRANEYGLPTGDDFDELGELDDDLTALTGELGGAYVGTLTCAGQRQFHIYTNAPAADWKSRLQAVSQRRGYALNGQFHIDVGHATYWEVLFPDSDQWQMISDLHVLRQLHESGDDGSATRRVDHWAYFPSATAAAEYSDWLREVGFEIEPSEDEEADEVCIRFFHESPVEWPGISHHTIALNRAAVQCGGRYDGWETFVCRPENNEN